MASAMCQFLLLFGTTPCRQTSQVRHDVTPSCHFMQAKEHTAQRQRICTRGFRRAGLGQQQSSAHRTPIAGTPGLSIREVGLWRSGGSCTLRACMQAGICGFALYI